VRESSFESSEKKGVLDMRKLFVPAALAALVLLAGTGLYAAAAKSAPEKITLDACVAKRSAVEFPHGAHAKAIACDTCHHTSKGLTATSTMEVPTCASCHNEPEKATTPKCSEMSMSKNHFHISCVNCHKEELKKDASKAMPTKCDDCHPKS
jgi:hypothetical protein